MNENKLNSSSNFRCKYCGFCCQLDVELTLGDIKIIKEVTDISFFKKKRQKPFLKKTKDFCVFFNFKTNRCGIYNNRPEVCRIFPKVGNKISTKCRQRKDFSSRVNRRLIEMFANEFN